ncbi:hypothetical protein GQ600_14637 [Phytophthora cactorum]|nr:hypothetical protein GQ600_14637 [Phytophthora cactorum]
MANALDDYADVSTTRNIDENVHTLPAAYDEKDDMESLKVRLQRRKKPIYAGLAFLAVVVIGSRSVSLEQCLQGHYRVRTGKSTTRPLTEGSSTSTPTPTPTPTSTQAPSQSSSGEALAYSAVDFDWSDASNWEYASGATVSSNMVTSNGITLTPDNSAEPIRTKEGWSGEKVVYIEWERTSTSDTNIWMLNTKLQDQFGKGNGWPYWGELDLFEMFTQDAIDIPAYDYSGFGGFSDVSSYGQLTMHMGPATADGSPCFCPASPSKSSWYQNSQPMTSGCTAQFSNDESNSIAAVWGSDGTGQYIQLIQNPTITKGGKLNGVDTYDVATGSGGVTSKIYNNAELFWGVDATDSCATAGGHDATEELPRICRSGCGVFRGSFQRLLRCDQHAIVKVNCHDTDYHGYDSFHVILALRAIFHRSNSIHVTGSSVENAQYFLRELPGVLQKASHDETAKFSRRIRLYAPFPLPLSNRSKEFMNELAKSGRFANDTITNRRCSTKAAKRNSGIEPVRSAPSKESTRMFSALKEHQIIPTTPAALWQFKELSLGPSAPSSRGIAELNKDNVSEKDVLEGLQTLFHSEYVLLAEYIEFMVPMLYSLYLSVLFHLPVAGYYPHSASMTVDKLHGTMTNILVYAVIEFVSFGALLVLLRRKFGFSPLYQLSFVLETQASALQGHLFVWTITILHLTLAHYGVDFNILAL